MDGALALWRLGVQPRLCHWLTPPSIPQFPHLSKGAGDSVLFGNDWSLWMEMWGCPSTWGSWPEQTFLCYMLHMPVSAPELEPSLLYLSVYTGPGNLPFLFGEESAASRLVTGLQEPGLGERCQHCWNGQRSGLGQLRRGQPAGRDPTGWEKASAGSACPAEWVICLLWVWGAGCSQPMGLGLPGCRGLWTVECSCLLQGLLGAADSSKGAWDKATTDLGSNWSRCPLEGKGAMTHFLPP